MQEKVKNNVFDVTEGPMMKKYISYVIPLVLITALQYSFNTADAIVVGRWGNSRALGGVSAAGPICALMLSLFTGLSSGCSIRMSKAIGEKNYDKAREYANVGVFVAIFSGFFIALFSIFFARPLFELLNTPEENIDYAVTYMRIIFAGQPIVLLYNFGAAAIRALGDTKRPLIFMAAAGSLNVGLNILLIAGFGMDADGAAIATIASNTLSVILIFRALSKGLYMFNIKIKEAHFNPAMFKDILATGLPLGLMNALWSFSDTIVQGSINSLGASVVAGIGAANSIITYGSITSAGFSQATTTFAAQNAGAGKYDRVKQITSRSTVMGMLITLCCASLIVIFRYPLIKLFITDDSAAIQAGCLKLLIVAPVLIISIAGGLHVNALQGMGKTLSTTVVSLIFDCGLNIIWIYTVFAYSPTLMTLLLMSPILVIPSFIAKYILFRITIKKAG